MLFVGTEELEEGGRRDEEKPCSFYSLVGGGWSQTFGSVLKYYLAEKCNGFKDYKRGPKYKSNNLSKHVLPKNRKKQNSFLGFSLGYNLKFELKCLIPKRSFFFLFGTILPYIFLISKLVHYLVRDYNNTLN